MTLQHCPNCGVHYSDVTNRVVPQKHDRSQIRKLFLEEGLNFEQIGFRVGTTGSLVRRILKDMGLVTKTKFLKATPENLARAKEMLEDRAGYREVEMTLGIPQSTLRRRFPGLGLTLEEVSERRRLAHLEQKILG